MFSIKEEIEKLPPVIQRYCEYIAIEGMPKYKTIRAYFVVYPDKEVVYFSSDDFEVVYLK